MCGLLGVKLVNICKDLGTSELVSLFDSTEPKLKEKVKEQLREREGKKERNEEKMERKKRDQRSDKQIKTNEHDRKVYNNFQRSTM